MAVSRLLLPLSAALLAGCAVGPDYVRPVPVLPDHFQGQSAVDRRPATARVDLDEWWTGFGDPLLTRFVSTALQQNLDIAQASARVAQARAGVTAATAALLPSAEISGQAASIYSSLQTPLGRVVSSSPGFERRGEAYEADLSANWEIDLFGGRRRGRQAAVAGYQASEAMHAATRLAVAAQTADVYVTLRGLQTRLDVANRQVRTQEDLLATVRALHERGLAAELQLQQAEGALAQVRASVPVLESALEAAENALDVMLATPPGTHREALAEATPLPLAPRIDATGSPGDLLRRRPDLIAAERRLAESSAGIGVAVAEFYPRLSLSGLIGSATSLSAKNLFSDGATQAAGLLGLRWRLFDFGRIDAQIDQARAREAEMLAAYRLAALHATEDVENAFVALVKREEQAATLSKGVEALGKARSSASAAYQAGVVSLIEVLQADQSLLLASDAQAQARTESARAAIAAFKALGSGWQAPQSGTVASR